MYKKEVGLDEATEQQIEEENKKRE